MFVILPIDNCQSIPFLLHTFGRYFKQNLFLIYELLFHKFQIHLYNLYKNTLNLLLIFELIFNYFACRKNRWRVAVDYGQH